MALRYQNVNIRKCLTEKIKLSTTNQTLFKNSCSALESRKWQVAVSFLRAWGDSWTTHFKAGAPARKTVSEVPSGAYSGKSYLAIAGATFRHRFDRTHNDTRVPLSELEPKLQYVTARLIRIARGLPMLLLAEAPIEIFEHLNMPMAAPGMFEYWF